MVLMPASFVGYRVLDEDIEQYRILECLPYIPPRIAYDIGSKVDVAPWLVLVEEEPEDDVLIWYLCCFAVHDPTPYDAHALSAIPVPPDFHRLAEVIPVEEVDNNPKLYRLFAPRTLVVPPPTAKRIDEYEEGMKSTRGMKFKKTM